MAEVLTTTGPLPLSELRETFLENWLKRLDPEAKYVLHEIHVGTGAGELIANRIVASDSMGRLWGLFSVVWDADLDNQFEVKAVN